MPDHHPATRPAPSRSTAWQRVRAAGPGRGRRLVRAAAYAVGFALPVTTLALLVRARWEPILRVDEAAIEAATAFARGRPGLAQSLIVWQEVWQPRWVYLVGSLVCLWVWRRRRLTSRALWAFLTMMAAWNIALDVKLLVQRARPVVEDALVHAPGYSFPSGHAANAAAATTVLVILLWPLLGPRARYAAIGLAVVATLVTAADRVLLGAHYPSDVVAGIILGSGLALASYAGYVGWNPTTPEPTVDPTTRPEG